MRGNQTLSGQPASDKELSTFRRALPQFIAVGVKNLVLFGYGMTLGFPTIFIPAVQGGDGRENGDENDLILTKEQISWLSSINLLCVPLGCFMSGFLTEPTGKRRAMQLVNIPMFVSWLLFYFSTNINYMYAGLCLSGLSGGLMEAPVLTYVAEVTQPQFRGMLAATGTTCVITGIFVQFILGSFLPWRSVAVASCFLPLFTVVALFFVPESPYWLLTKGRVNEARNSLTWLRGWVPFSKVEQEFNEIYDVLSVRRREAEEAKLLPFYKRVEPFTGRGFIVPFILVSGTFFIGHFSGKTPLQTYAVQIFSTLKAPIDKYYATIILGAAELLGAFTCVLLVHSTGKRPLVFTSLIGTGICFFGAATYAWNLSDFPGIILDNVVANSSLPVDFHRSYVINENNLTKIVNVLNTSNDTELLNFETTTEPNDYDSSEVSFDLELESSTTETNDTNEATTLRFKRMNLIEAILNETDATDQDNLNKIILPLPKIEENKYLWLPLTLLITGAYFAHLGIRIIPWMLIGEVFPVNVRSAASGLSSGFGYIFAFLANKLFLQMCSVFTLPGTFWFYSAVAIIGCIILYFVLPETENRKLIDIEAHFLGKKSLSEKVEKLDANNGNATNTRTNGFDVVTVVPQSVNQNTFLTKGNSNGNGNGNYNGNEAGDGIGNETENGNGNVDTNLALNEVHRLSVPEIFINKERSPNAGSKRYKHRVSDTLRSRSIDSTEDTQDTRL